MLPSNRPRQLLALLCLPLFVALAQQPDANQRVFRGTEGSSLWRERIPTTVFSANSSQSTLKRYSFLRFFADGKVIGTEFATAATIAEVEKWDFCRASFAVSSKLPNVFPGGYSISGSSIKFSLTYPNGAVDYDGVIQGSSLQLNWFSHSNNGSGKSYYDLVLPESIENSSQGDAAKQSEGETARAAATAQQPSISISSDPTSGKSRTFLAGQFTTSQNVDAVLHTFDNNMFICTLVQPLEKGEVIAAMTSEDQAWSMAKTPTGYPIEASVKSSDGKFRSLFPAVLKVKIDIKAGTVLHSGRYDIETKRSIKAGDSIPVFFIGGRSLLSIEAAEGTGKGGEAQPWFTVFEGDAKPDDRRATIEAWRTEKDHVRAADIR